MDIKLILSYTRRTVDSYEMIEEGDRIAVGVSGGKDSLALLCALAHLRKFYPKKFDIVAISIDMGFEGTDYSGIKALCEELEVELKIVKTQIYQIIFDVRKEDSPCSLCSRMRRGALNDAADEFSCNKVALGHHMDDVIETYMMNLFFAGKIGTFSPVTYLDRSKITCIRPLIYVPEKDIRYFASKENLPVFKNKCPADGNTERENMKKRLFELQREIPDIKNKIFGAIQRAEISGFKPLKK
ncbi:MAG: tRNA 2-thiocytidine(32) synthetase TtcA [Ruminococcaceae bacterium]|nr:tRNA 2-thiocytidine(32) synthetase TtcA [Oscillospiraceae bacterium]